MSSGCPRSAASSAARNSRSLLGLRRAAQPCRAFQNLDRHRHGAAPQRARRHQVVFASELVVRSDRCCGTMPQLAVELIVNHGSKRGVDPLAGRRVGGLVHGGANERMPKPHLRPVDLDELRGDRGRDGIDTHALAQHGFGGGKDFVERCPVVLRRHEQQQLRDVREVGQATGEGALEPVGQRKPRRISTAARSPRGSSTRASGLPEASRRKRLRSSARRPGALASSKRSASA